MKKTILRVAGLFVLAALLMGALLPGAVYATLTDACRFYGPITLDGANVTLNAEISATVEGRSGGPWTTTPFMYNGSTWYALDIPGDASEAGDIIRLQVAINGVVYPGPNGACAEPPDNNIWAPIRLAGVEPLTIVTTSLPEHRGLPYTATVVATGGTPPYTFSATGLPAGMSISLNGTITGAPPAGGVYSINVTVMDTAGAQASKTLSLNVVWIPGDANGDQEVDVVDVQATVLMILGLTESTPGADVNGDGVIDVLDVYLIEQIILGVS